MIVLLIQAALMFISIPVTGLKDTAPGLIVILATAIGIDNASLPFSRLPFTIWLHNA